MLSRDDPIDSGVSSDAFVVGINHDDFEEFEGGVLTNPIGVEDAEIAAFAADSLLSVLSVRLC